MLAAQYHRLDRPHDFFGGIMRVYFFKTMIDTEIAFKYLSKQEQVEFINTLIKDVNQLHPEAKLQLFELEEDYSLDW